MLLLKVMMVAMFKLTNDINDFQDFLDVTPANDDGHHIQDHK